MEFPFWIFVILAILFAFAFALRKITPSDTISYKLRPVLLTAVERSFFGVLAKVVKDSALIFAKVRVTDIVAPAKGDSRSHWQKAFNRISSKHFDFVLCKSDDLGAICVIELNDKSHESKKHALRDDILRDICESAGLPLIEVTAKQTYNPQELTSLLTPFLEKL